MNLDGSRQILIPHDIQHTCRFREILMRLENGAKWTNLVNIRLSSPDAELRT